MGVTIDDARAIAATLPRSYEALVRDRVKFRVGQIVYAAFSRDETIMGFGFPREERDALVASEPDKFLMPSPSDMRFRWVQVRLDAIDVDELRELLVDAWRMCVPKKVRDAYNHANASGAAASAARRPTTNDCAATPAMVGFGRQGARPNMRSSLGGTCQTDLGRDEPCGVPECVAISTWDMTPRCRSGAPLAPPGRPVHRQP
jgi:hypothetical protein